MIRMAEHYSEQSFREKLSKYAKTAGREVIEKALELHYAARAPQTPTWARTVIYGTLAYFILPTDAIPDWLVGAGYSDDLSAMVGALVTVAAYVTPEIKEQARAKVRGWFGE